MPGLGWTTADQLRPGQQLLTENGQYASVLSTAIEEHPEGISVYNLTVDGDHTYFVTTASGEEGVWVHNDGPTTEPSTPYYDYVDLASRLRDLWERQAYDYSVHGGTNRGPDGEWLSKRIGETQDEIRFRELLSKCGPTTPLPPTDPNAPSMSALAPPLTDGSRLSYYLNSGNWYSRNGDPEMAAIQ